MALQFMKTSAINIEGDTFSMEQAMEATNTLNEGISKKCQGK